MGQGAEAGARGHRAPAAPVPDQLVATVGEQPNFDPTAFATLTAADFSANDQLARLIGESDFNTLFHQGEKESMYLADVARRVILVVLFDNRTTLGLVRLKMKLAVDESRAVRRRRRRVGHRHRCGRPTEGPVHVGVEELRIVRHGKR